jgi:hypothetical protein
VLPWSHATNVMVSARLRQGDTGITRARIVVLMKIVRCLTSCSFMTRDHGTVFRVQRMHQEAAWWSPSIREAIDASRGCDLGRDVKA